MSRYPSADVERFDQQFAETEDERNERLRKRHLKKCAGKALAYAEWCRNPNACIGKGYCPLDPTCGD